MASGYKCYLQQIVSSIPGLVEQEYTKLVEKMSGIMKREKFFIILLLESFSHQR